jgi:5-methylcytosine-specific restriction endonuclease McrBC regulatory subunit McrC
VRRYGSPLYYYAAIFMDFALRLCWSLKLSSHLQRHASGQAWVFLFEVLEVFRRFVWNFFRVEWECVNQKHTGDVEG